MNICLGINYLLLNYLCGLVEKVTCTFGYVASFYNSLYATPDA